MPCAFPYETISANCKYLLRILYLLSRSRQLKLVHMARPPALMASVFAQRVPCMSLKSCATLLWAPASSPVTFFSSSPGVFCLNTSGCTTKDKYKYVKNKGQSHCCERRRKKVSVSNSQRTSKLCV